MSSPTTPSARSVTVLAHPLRSRLLLQLRAVESATATSLARALGTNTGATSYHLRRLESVGLVHDTGSGRGRERVWAATESPSPYATHEAYQTPDAPYGQDDDTASALAWLERDYVRHVATKAEQWLDVADTWPPAWSAQLGLADHAALVTLEQLVALRAELEEVLQRYRRVGQGNPGAKRVAVYTYAYPVDLANVPAP